MAYDFLYCVNRLCNKFNEVPLTSSTFATADGVYSEFKNAVNAAVTDIYQAKNNEWPFAWQEIQFKTVVGTGQYTKSVNAINVDWDSFQILKQPITLDTLTQSAGLATATYAAGHGFKTNDYIYISGANQTDYVGYFYITVTSATQFTFAVSSSAVTPATGTISVFPPYGNTKLKFIDYDAYRDEKYQERDNEAFKDGQYSTPFFAVRKTDNNIILSPKPDRIYTVQYDSFVLPSNMELYSDTPAIPEVFADVLIDGATWYAYMFRDNVEQADIQRKRYEENVETMARMLIPQQTFMRVVD